MNDSSFGSAAPKNRSINVGANLLGEWIAERTKERQRVARYGALLGMSLLTAAVTLPGFWGSTKASATQAESYRRKIAELDQALVVSDRAKKAAQPAVVVRAMCDRTAESFDRLMAQMGRVLAAGNARTALASVRCDVAAGEAHVVVQADAEEDGAADAFARNAGGEGAKVDAIVNSRPSHLLSPQGLAFQYEKRIGVDK